MLANTDISEKFKYWHNNFPKTIWRIGLCATILFSASACTSNNNLSNNVSSPVDTTNQVVAPTDAPQTTNPSPASNGNTPNRTDAASPNNSKILVHTPQPEGATQTPTDTALTQTSHGAMHGNETNTPAITETASVENTEKTVNPQPKKTNLLSFFKKQKEDVPPTQPVVQQESNNTPVKSASASLPDNTNVKEPSDSVKPQETVETTQPAGTPQQPPVRDATSQKKGSLMRLFGHSDVAKQDKPQESETKTALIPLPKKDTHEYNDVLPGVRPDGGIVIKHRSSLYDDTDIDANEGDSNSIYTLASVSLYGRSLPNGLKLARKEVEVSCLKPQLIVLLKTIERRFGKPVIITSGYRSPSYNRQVNGAKRSMHMSCAAADIIVPDVDKWEVAKFARSLPGRGGVGTYCNQSIHVDVGPKRDWNWSCSAKNN